MLGFERKLNLLIGYPNHGEVTSQFNVSLVNMMAYLMSKPVEGFREQRMQPMEVRGSILPRSRAKLVMKAEELKCTHLLFIDTDQRFPKDTAHRLLAWKKDVVACNIATKQIPASPTARKKATSIDGEPVYTDAGQTGLERVWRVGTGIMLLDMIVFRKIGPGVFEIRWVPELKDYRGEDWAMCEAIDKAGYNIYIDHGLSQEIGHIGPFDFTHDVVGEKKMVEVKQIGER